jgi:hypothetical protein
MPFLPFIVAVWPASDRALPAPCLGDTEATEAMCRSVAKHTQDDYVENATPPAPILAAKQPRHLHRGPPDEAFGLFDPAVLGSRCSLRLPSSSGAWIVALRPL